MFADLTAAGKEALLASLTREEANFLRKSHNLALDAGMLDPVVHGGRYNLDGELPRRSQA